MLTDTVNVILRTSHAPLSMTRSIREAVRTVALGAGRARIVKIAVQPAVLTVVAGLFAGLALSVGLNTVVARWSIGNLKDPVVLVAVSVVLFAAMMISPRFQRTVLPRFSRRTPLRID
jgi:hypothetical protein